MNQGDKENRIATTGIITDIVAYRNNDDIDYKVYVSYNVGNNIYESKLNAYMSSFYEGKK